MAKKKKKRGFGRRSSDTATATPPQSNRPSKRKQWTDEQMQGAMDDVTTGRCSANGAAKKHGVPPSTLKDRLSGRIVHGTKSGPKPYLSAAEEEELAGELISAANIGYGKTRAEVLTIVERHVELKEDVSLKGARVTHGWWQKFKERNPSVSLRSGDSTAAVRLDAVNEENMNNYFDMLKDVFDKGDFWNHPEAIYNMDESGMPLEPRPPKVVARKGQKKVRYQTSGQKQQITVIDCGSATGQCLPPFVIFAAKKLNHMWCKNEVNGTNYAYSDKGWIDHELFFHFLEKHFLAHAVPRRPLLLLLDGHSTHSDLMSLKFARDHKVTIFCLPPHTIHECQPLDCSLFKPLKDRWRQECHKFYCQNPGTVISKLNFNFVFRNAWLKAITPENFVSGFRKTGVYPFNRHAISCASASTSSNGHSSEVARGTYIILFINIYSFY